MKVLKCWRARFLAGGTGDFCEGSSSREGFYLLIPGKGALHFLTAQEIVHPHCALLLAEAKLSGLSRIYFI